MYSPIYTISNKILKNIGSIEGSKEIIETAPLVPSFEKQFQSDAALREIHHGTHIEGNDLTLYQVKKVLEGAEVYGKARDIQEIVNYKNGINFLEELLARRGGYDKSMFLGLHKFLSDRIVVPEKSGVFRSTEVVIKEEGTGRIIFSPPPAHEIPYLLDDFVEWLNTSINDIHPVIRAGIAHYILSAIFPFIEANGKVLKLFTSLVLIKEGYGVKKFFAMEEIFDTDPGRYYEILSAPDSEEATIGNKNLTLWLEYFTESYASELLKIKERVKKLSIDSKLKIKFGEQVSLTERQMRLIEYVSDRGSAGMGELKKVLPMVSEDTVLRELQDLTKKGIIRKQGSTKASKYVISNK